jgi:hypothetical protein
MHSTCIVNATIDCDDTEESNDDNNDENDNDKEETPAWA